MCRQGRSCEERKERLGEGKAYLGHHSGGYPVDGQDHKKVIPWQEVSPASLESRRKKEGHVWMT